MDAEDVALRLIRALAIAGAFGLLVASGFYFIEQLGREIFVEPGRTTTNPYWVAKSEYVGLWAFGLAATALALTPLPVRRRGAAATARGLAALGLFAMLFHLLTTLTIDAPGLLTAVATGILAAGLLLAHWAIVRDGLGARWPALTGAAAGGRRLLLLTALASAAYLTGFAAVWGMFDFDLLVAGHEAESAAAQLGPVAVAWAAAGAAWLLSRTVARKGPGHA